MPKVHVFCSRPGMFRGGRKNPRHAAYAPDVHTPAELRDLLADPEVTVVIGDELTADHPLTVDKPAKAKG